MKKEMTNAEVNKILTEIYTGNPTHKHLAAIVRQIWRLLDQRFPKDTASVEQKMVIDKLLTVADQIEDFCKEIL